MYSRKNEVINALLICQNNDKNWQILHNYNPIHLWNSKKNDTLYVHIPYKPRPHKS